jgi:hypothetical protein
LITNQIISISELENVSLGFISSLCESPPVVSKTPNYKQHFEHIWRRNFIDLGIPEDILEDVLEAEWKRYLRKDKDYFNWSWSDNRRKK